MIEEFERQRPRLVGLAYRMLGSAADAEDVVQDAYLRWQRAEPGSIRTPSAWLAKVTTNLRLNLLDSAPRRRERPAGPWLPEPVLTADGSLGPMETAEQLDTVSLAFLVLAERLTPAERAVLLGVLVPDVAGGRIIAIRIVADRQKLRFLDRQLNRLSRSGEPSGS